MRSVQQMKTVVLQPPKDMNGLIVGGNVSAICLRNYHHAIVNVMFGNLAGDCTIALQQAKNVGGSGIKTLSFSEIFWIDTDNTDPLQADRAVLQTVTSDVYTVANASQDNGLFKIEVRPAMLDVDNGFDCIRPLVTAAGAATLLAVWIDLVLGRYTGKENDQRVFPSALGHG